MNKTEVLALCNIIKNETGAGKNTHTRIGNALSEIVNLISDSPESTPSIPSHTASLTPPANPADGSVWISLSSATRFHRLLNQYIEL